MLTLRVSILLFAIGIIRCENQSSEQVDSTLDLKLPASLTSHLNKAKLFENQDEILRLLREKCEKNGGANAFKAAGDAIKEGQECFSSVLGEIVQHEDFERGVIPRSRRYCSKTSRFEGCFEVAAAGVRPCLAADETHYLDDAKTAIHDYFEFECANDAEKYAEYQSVDAINCRKSHRGEYYACYHGEVDSFLIGSVNLTNATPDDIVQRIFPAERCGKLHDLKSCVVNVYRQCNSSISADYHVVYYDATIKATNCSDQTSGATRSLSRSHVSRVGR